MGKAPHSSITRLGAKYYRKIPQLPFGFFNADQNQAGKLQTRIDRGIGSLTRLVQIFFIDILPLFSSAIVALGLMYYANFYVGLVATSIIPIYFWLTFQQAKKLGGWRRNLRDGREKRAKAFSVLSSRLA